MGASKTKQFSAFEKQIANIGRALSHPARVRIIEILHQRDWCRNIDLTKDLQLSPSTINSHLDKLKQAEIINIDFALNCYRVSLNHNGITNLKDWSSNYQ